MKPCAGRSHVSSSPQTFTVKVLPGSLAPSVDCISVTALKNTPSWRVVQAAASKLGYVDSSVLELAEIVSTNGALVKERRLNGTEMPVCLQLVWPRQPVSTPAVHRTQYSFCLCRKEPEYSSLPSPMAVDSFLSVFLRCPAPREYPDLCNLPDLNELTLLDSLKRRFCKGDIYTYVGSILIAVNPFKFYPIYNPKYVKMYQKSQLVDLPPHIFAVADAAYHKMLERRACQCIVITGESGSGKTESTNLLLHHLSALSLKGLLTSGIEQTILGAGPVLEAFGNAKTVHNNNSSRFGKFIQVNFKENGMVHGAIVEKYLLEKSRIISQAQNERNYHVFYYLLSGASTAERQTFGLARPHDFAFLNQNGCYTLENVDGDSVDEVHEFLRLKQSMEMVGFSTAMQRDIFTILAAVLHIGNIELKKKPDHHHDAVSVKNFGVVQKVSELLQVAEFTLVEALTCKKTMAGGERVIMSHNMAQAQSARNAMAKTLYVGLFDWIVLRVNRALLSRHENVDNLATSIGVLDIFGFEDFACNSFEQLCINYANEHLHYYFNQHIFKFEQEEYHREGIVWQNIDFIDNTACLDLFASRPAGIWALFDEECNFPGANNMTLLSKLHTQHRKSAYYQAPQMRENAFSIMHYAGKVKYQIEDFREKNTDLMRHDIIFILKNSKRNFVRQLVSFSPVATFRWAILKAVVRAVFAFRSGAARHKALKKDMHHSIAGDVSLTKSAALKVAPERTQVRRMKSYHGTSSAEDRRPIWRPHHGPLNALNGPAGRAQAVAARNLLRDGRDDPAIHRANLIVTKGKQMKARGKFLKSQSGLDLRSVKNAVPKSVCSPRKNKASSVSAEFNFSLQKLMETLNRANPFFIRCIKSNANKTPCLFDEEVVLKQLRYTGMLATVEIRQSGFNYRLTYEEFVSQYKILLHKGLRSSPMDIRNFLSMMNMNRENYQIGKTKVFLRETEKRLLDVTLHEAIMVKIVCIQRWTRTWLARRHFQLLKNSSVIIQSHVRGMLARRLLNGLRAALDATILIQRVFRGYTQRKRFLREVRATSTIQKHWRNFLQHRKVKRGECSAVVKPGEQVVGFNPGHVMKLSLTEPKTDHIDVCSSTSDEGVLTKESSTEEIFKDCDPIVPDSESSSGILDDSEGDSLFVSGLQTSPNVESSRSILHVQKGPSDVEIASPSALPPLEIFYAPDNVAVPNKKVLPPLRMERPERNGQESGDVSPLGLPGRYLSRDADHSPLSDGRKDYERTFETERLIGEAVSGHGAADATAGSSQLASPPASQEKERKVRRKNSKKRRRTFDRRPELNNSWNVAGTSQWKCPSVVVASGSQQILQLEQFVLCKINGLRSNSNKPCNVFDEVFCGSLVELHKNLITETSVALQGGMVELRYKDLMASFEELIITHIRHKVTNDDFPVTMAINAFRGFLDEFLKKKDNRELPKVAERKKEKKRKNLQVQDHLGHKFVLVQFSIPTYCEQCSSLIWLVEKGQVCQVCKLTVHKKCFHKISSLCKAFQKAEIGGMVFGVQLESQLKAGQKLPQVVEKLIQAIEVNGLYTEGIYRKAGAAVKARQLVKMINEDIDAVDFNDYSVHCLTTVIKAYFRDLPEPLLTYDLYDEFLNATQSTIQSERLANIYAVIKKLPEQNHDLFQRLVFHLAKIALHESSNKMSSNGLSIIFAPSLLRSRRDLPAQECLLHVTKQANCLCAVIEEQMNRMQLLLSDISLLDAAAISYSDRLTTLRSSRKDDQHQDGEEKNLTAHIESLKQEKQELTVRLPAFDSRHSSSEEDLLSVDDADESCEEPILSFDLPAVAPSHVRHLNKRRAPTPRRKPPTRLASVPPPEECNPSFARQPLATPKLEQVGDEIIV